MTAPGSEVRLPQVPLLVHFVDRPRGAGVGPLAVRNLSGSQRLSNILLTGYLRGFYLTGASTPIVAASDLSPAELRHAFKDGLNTRGRPFPWAIVFHRVIAWDLGMRPVIYVEDQYAYHFREATEKVRGPGWGSLVVPTELDPQAPNDWTHEREWRFCFPRHDEDPALEITAAVRAVIVGESEWLPSPVADPHPDVAGTNHPTCTVERWHWNGQGLIHDGSFPIEEGPEGGAQ